MIYFIGEPEGRYVKIGYTKADPVQRLRQMQPSNARDLKIIFACDGSRDAEREIHQALSPWHVRGEWFRESLHLVVLVCTIGGDDYWRILGIDLHQSTPRDLNQRLFAALHWERALASEGIFEEPGGWVEWIREGNAMLPGGQHLV